MITKEIKRPKINKRPSKVPRVISDLERDRINTLFDVSKKIAKVAVENALKLKGLPLRHREVAITSELFAKYPKLHKLLERLDREDPGFSKKLREAINARIELEAKHI